jgi:hypothetical protein
MDILSTITNAGWALVIIGGPIALAAALAYGIHASRSRRRRRVDDPG